MSHHDANLRESRAAAISPRGRTRRRRQESGYAYLMALFMVLVVIIASSEILLSSATQARRQREDEMMWRGKQYVRAIKLYYRKTGHYPQNLDDLQKGFANIHFLRQAYKDPMNGSEDGKWRFIYTNATGQIIGSVRYATMQQMAILDLMNMSPGGSLPGAAGQDSNVTPVPQPDDGASNGNCPQTTGNANSSSPASGIGATNGFSTNQGIGSQGGINQGSAAPCPPNQNGQNPQQVPGGLLGGALGQMGQIGGGQLGAGQLGSQLGSPQVGMQSAQLQALLQMKPTGPVDSPVIGGFIVGVGSTSKAKSVKVYKHGKTYDQWEFIWNPLEEQALAMQQGMNQGAGGMGLLGLGGQNAGPGGATATPTGTSPGQQPPTSPPQTPPQTPPQPQ